MTKGLHKDSLRKGEPNRWIVDDVIEKIRAEVERLKGQLIRGACSAQIEMETNCKDEAYNEVLAKLDTIGEKSEKPINPVLQDFPTTEKEMQDFLATHERIPVPERLNSLERILQKQPVCEGLYDFMKKRSESLFFHDDFEIAAYKKGVVDGAKWQKEQMMKEAIDVTLNYTHQITLEGGEGFGKKGEHIRLFIIKED